LKVAGVKYQIQNLNPKPIGGVWKLVEFTINQFPGVSFRCVWGVRNYLPHPSILKNAII
jgi:hypothetical protein